MLAEYLNRRELRHMGLNDGSFTPNSMEAAADTIFHNKYYILQPTVRLHTDSSAIDNIVYYLLYGFTLCV